MLATVVSTIYLVSFYLRRKSDIKKDLKDAIETPMESRNSIIKKVLKLTIPISLSSVVLTLSGVIDLATVKNCLLTFMDDNNATTQIGILFGKVDMLTNLPLALNVAFAMVLVPTVASAMALGNKKAAKEKSSLSLLITILIGLPCTIGLYVLAEPILALLFPSTIAVTACSSGLHVLTEPITKSVFPIASATLILQLASLATIFSAIAQTLSGTLQGLGKVMVPAIATIVRISC